MVERLLTLLSQRRVDPIQIMDITQDHELTKLWRMLPRDMIFVTKYVIGASNLLDAWRLKHYSMSFYEDDDPPLPPPHHDEGVLKPHISYQEG